MEEPPRCESRKIRSSSAGQASLKGCRQASPLPPSSQLSVGSASPAGPILPQAAWGRRCGCFDATLAAARSAERGDAIGGQLQKKKQAPGPALLVMIDCRRQNRVGLNAEYDGGPSTSRQRNQPASTNSARAQRPQSHYRRDKNWSR